MRWTPTDLTVVVEHNDLAMLIEQNDAHRIYRIRAFSLATVADLIGCETLDHEALARRVPRATQQFETRRALALAVHALFFDGQDD